MADKVVKSRFEFLSKYVASRQEIPTVRRV